jgi:O-antigen ligase
LVVLLVLLGNRFRKLLVFAIPFVIIGGLYVAHGLIASDDYSWGTRVEAWRIVLEISRVSPLLGMGFSNYYWYTPLFPIRGWRVSFNSHSQFVDLIAQTGYIGLLCFLWLLFMVARLSWNYTNKLPGGFDRGYSAGVFAGVIGTLFAAFLVDWVLPFVYNIGLNGFRASILPWIFMGGMIAIEQMQLQKSES